jgi:hypothetical protein
MKRLGELSILAMICFSVPALAEEMPARKAGLWEIKTNTGSANVPQVSMKQCIDAATDKMMQNNAGPPGASKQCTQSNIQRSGSTITIDSTCNIAGRSTTSHMVINGNFDSSYTMTITSQGEGVPGGGHTMTMNATWLGPCAADQRPGDMIMANGMKMNILDIQKRGPGMMMAPPGH